MFDPVAVVGHGLDRGMAVDDQLAVVARVVVEFVADPEKVGLVLFGQREPGADAGVDEDMLVGLEARRQALEEGPRCASGTAARARGVAS